MATIGTLDGFEIEQNLSGITLHLLNSCDVPGLETFTCILSVIPQQELDQHQL